MIESNTYTALDEIVARKALSYTDASGTEFIISAIFMDDLMGDKTLNNTYINIFK